MYPREWRIAIPSSLMRFDEAAANLGFRLTDSMDVAAVSHEEIGVDRF